MPSLGFRANTPTEEKHSLEALARLGTARYGPTGTKLSTSRAVGAAEGIRGLLRRFGGILRRFGGS